MSACLKLQVGLLLLFTFTRTSAIHGGDVAVTGQFPFSVSLSTFGYHICGGAIIDQHWVVTSAQCVFNHSSAHSRVRVGTTQLYKGGSVFNVSKIVIHPDFTDHTFLINDIAMVKIDGAFEFGDLVQPVGIKAPPLPYQLATVSGWGATVNVDPSDDLLYTRVLMVDEETCTKMSQRGQNVYPRGPGQFCTMTSAGFGPCERDVGGPLVIEDNYLVGIVSYSVSSRCATGYPDVFTMTEYYIDWINGVIEKN